MANSLHATLITALLFSTAASAATNPVVRAGRTLAATDVHLALPSSLNDRASAPNWDRMLDRGNNGRIKFGVSLNGPSPYERNNTTPFAPASNSKLFTATLALERFGADWTYTTTLAWTDLEGSPGSAANVTLVGSGDPSLGLADLGETLTTRVDTYAAALAAAGVKAIFGEIRIEAGDPRWDARQYPEGWSDADKGSCDGAPAQALNLNLNCATFEVRSTKRGRWLEPGVPTPVDLDLKPGARTNVSVTLTDDGGLRLSGRINLGGRPLRLSLPVLDAKGWLRNLLIEALKKRGIALNPAAANQVAAGAHQTQFDSPPLKAILKPMLKHSQNLVAEALLRAVAVRFGPAGTADLATAGREVLKSFVDGLGGRAAQAAAVAAQPGFFGGDVELADGSGLSRASRVTTDAMMALLLDLRAEPEFQAVWDALPIAGVDGTLASRMKGTPAAGVLRAKTGTLDGVYNLSGYVPRRGSDGAVSEYVPFVILTQTTADGEQTAHQIEDQIGAALAGELNPR